MQIKFISLKFDQDGGGSNRSLELLTNLLSQEHDVEIITLRQDMNNYEHPPVPVHEHSSSSWPSTFSNLFKILKNNEENTDLYHIFSPNLIPVGGIYRKRGGNTPVVGRLNTYSLFCTNPSIIQNRCYENCSLYDKIKHDNVDMRSKPGNLHKYIFNHSSIKLSSLVDKLFALSPAVSQIYNDAGVTSDIEVIPNFYDPEFGCVSDDRNNGAISILFVGRLVPEKGVSSLIQSINDLNRNNIRLEIVGDGPLRGELESLSASLDIENCVQFHGWISHEDLPKYYSKSDIFVHPGLWPEPFGRTILEAMQHDLPMIVSNIGAPPWIAGELAEKFEPGSVSDLTSSLKAILEKCSNGEKRVDYTDQLNNYSPNSIVMNIIANYEEIV